MISISFNINITFTLPSSKPRIKKWDFARHYAFKKNGVQDI